jgi:predicted phage terminase large subunit-like protein
MAEETTPPTTAGRVTQLAKLGYTEAEIAQDLDLTLEVLQRQFEAALKEGWRARKEALRQAQFTTATKGNVTMLVHIDKRDQAQHDREADSAAMDRLRDLSDAELEELIGRSTTGAGSDAVTLAKGEIAGPLREKQRREAERDLACFVRLAWPILQPGRELIWSWHYDLLCEYLARVKQRAIRRLLVNVPPRTAKSTIATICFPCWIWATEPHHCFLCASYSRELSTEHSVARRNLLLSEWYQRNWGNRFQLASDQNLKTQFDNNRHGQMIATSVGGTVTGKGGDTLIVDDPLSADQAVSTVERKNANDWFEGTLRSRLNDPRQGAIVVIMQRLHELDLTGFLLQTEKDEWTQLKIPLEAEEHESWTYPISGHVYRRVPGEVLQPERFSPEYVENLKKHALTFAGQYQQRPAPLEGNIIKRAHIRYYGGIDPVTGQPDETLPQQFDLEVLSIDCAFKDLETSDFVAIGRIGLKGHKRYLLKVINAHLGMSATEDAIRREREARHVNATLVEDKGNGPAIIERLRRNLPGVIAVNPAGGKLARFMAAAPEWEAGDWYVDRNAAWTEPFIQQIITFPNAAHDDMADMMSQASIWLHKRGDNVVRFWEAQANTRHRETETQRTSRYLEEKGQ